MNQFESFFPQDTFQGRNGCYVAKPDLLGLSYKKALVPIGHLDYHLEIVNSLLHISLVQHYYNPTEKYLEVSYSLPVWPESTVYKFEAEFNNVKLEGIVKEKEQAKKECEQAKSEGRQAAIVTVDADSKDILNMSIGNIPPKTQFKVTIAFLREMAIGMNSFYRLVVPSTISPRYLKKVENAAKVSKPRQQKGELHSKAGFTWTFKIEIKTSKKLVFFESSSHKLSMISQNKEATETLFIMKKEEIPNKDFHFVYSIEDFHLPSCVVGKTGTSSTIMLSLIPKFCSLSIDDAYKAYLEGRSYEVDMAAAKGDFVFFLDRSGSMQGPRIEKAKEALVMFLKSLPEDCYFNVISFGSKSKRMFSSSEKYSKTAFEKAKKEIEEMSADMGGTQIYDPLQKLLAEEVNLGYPRHVFILTDGGVSNTEGVISMVEKSTKYCRVHCIGISNGCSLQLINGCSKAGKGKSILISDEENPSNKIIQLLESILTPLISKVNLKIKNDKAIQSIFPNPESMPYILKDEVVNFYITFNQNHEKEIPITFEYEDSTTKLPYKSQMKANFQAANTNPHVDKMAHLKVLRTLESLAKSNEPIEAHMYYPKVQDYTEECINYSIKHQVLSEYTALVSTGKQLIDGQYQEYRDALQIEVQVKQPQPGSQQQQQQQEEEEWRQVQQDEAEEETMWSTSRLKNLTMSLQQGVIEFLGKQGRIRLELKQKIKKGFFGRLRSTVTGLLISGKDMIKQQIQQKWPKKQGLKEQQPKLQEPKQSKLEKQPESSTPIRNITEIIDQQQLDGSWTNPSLITLLAKNPQHLHNLIKSLTSTTSTATPKTVESLVVTQLVASWIQKNYGTEKQYMLIVRKAGTWVKKILEQNSGISAKLLDGIESL